MENESGILFHNIFVDKKVFVFNKHYFSMYLHMPWDSLCTICAIVHLSPKQAVAK